MKRLLFLICTAVLCVMSAYGSGTYTVDGMTYHVTGEDGHGNTPLATLMGFADGVVMSHVTVPAEIYLGEKRFYVREIADNAFNGQTAITNVTIDVSGLLNYIGDFAFCHCSNLSTLTFIGSSHNLRICKYAFGRTSIEEVELPDMHRLDTLVFWQCTKLEKVTFNDIYYMNRNVFVDCTKLNTIIWNSAQELKVAIEGVSDKNSRSITNDPSTTPFWFLKAKIIQVLAGISDKTDVIIPAYLFNGFNQLNSVVIGPGVKKIGNGAFMECFALNSMSLRTAESLTTIGDSAFYLCPLVGNLALQCSNLNYIGEKAFLGSNYRSIELANVSGGPAIKVGELAFSNNTATKITIRANIAKLGYGAFASPAATEIYYAPANGYASQSINDNPFVSCAAVTDLTINHGGAVNEFMFPQCTGIRRLFIENATTVVGSSFHNCSNIQEVVWNVTEQEDYDSYSYPFRYSNHITSCTVKSERVPAYLLYGQRDLKEWTASPNTTSIGMLALSYSGIEELTLEAAAGKNMTIDNFAFYHCDRLRRIRSEYYNPPQLGGTGVFRDVNTSLSNVTLVVPDEDSKQLYKNTAIWKEFFTIAEGIEDVRGGDVRGTKVVENGKVYIQRGERLFDLTGARVR